MSNLTHNPDNEFQTFTPGTFITEQFSQMEGQQEHARLTRRPRDPCQHHTPTLNFCSSLQRCVLNKNETGVAALYLCNLLSPPVEAFQHDRIFGAQVVCRQGAGLPAKTLISVGKVLRPCNICAELRGEGGWLSCHGVRSGQVYPTPIWLTSFSTPY